MKNIIKSALLVVMSLFLMTACSDDNDSNPTIQSPTEFKLNTPALQNTPHDQTGDVVVYKVQKRVLAAYGQEQGLGEKGDGVPQGEKRQREKQGGEHRAV